MTDAPRHFSPVVSGFEDEADGHGGKGDGKDDEPEELGDHRRPMDDKEGVDKSVRAGQGEGDARVQARAFRNGLLR